MDESILNSTKLILGIGTDDTTFDVDIITHINMVISLLSQLGVPVPDNFTVSGTNEEWSDLTSDTRLLQYIKTYLYLKVRIAFDPPNGSVLEAMKELISELEWRINVESDDVDT